MHRAHRHLVVLREVPDRVDLLADRVDADHHLDRVVAEPRGELEAVRRRLGVDRGGGQGDQPAHADLVQPLEDDALAQRPRADLQLGEVEQVHHRVGDQRAGDDLVRPARRDAGQVGDLLGRHLQQLRDPARAASRRRAPGAPAARRPTGAAPQIRASERNVFEVATAWSGAGRSDRAGVAGDVRPGSSGAARAPRPASSAVGEVVAGQPAGAERQRLRDVRAPRRSRPRSPASRRRCRRRPAVPRTSRTTGARRGTSAGPRPRPGSTSMSTPVSSRTCVEHRRRSSSASRTAEVAKPAISSQPLSSATTSDEATKLGQRLDAAVGDRAGRRRGARPAAAAPCGSTPASAPRRRCASTTSRCPVLEPMSRTPSLMGENLSRRRRVCPRARDRPRHPACLRRVRRPRRRGAGVQVRPDLADVAVHVHLRPGLPRASTPSAPTTAAARSARTSPTRTTRSAPARS